MLGESKCGKHIQSMEPSIPTRAEVRMFPIILKKRMPLPTPSSNRTRQYD
jgi:hypothetical protein